MGKGYGEWRGLYQRGGEIVRTFENTEGKKTIEVTKTEVKRGKVRKRANRG